MPSADVDDGGGHVPMTYLLDDVSLLWRTCMR